MPGNQGRPGDGTWDLWPLATAGLGGMLTGSASSHQAGQAPLATRGMSLLDPTADPNQWEGGDAIDMAPELPVGHPHRCAPEPPLRRLTSIQDRTAPGAGDSLAEPTMAP
jgi:hypothetical protein